MSDERKILSGAFLRGERWYAVFRNMNDIEETDFGSLEAYENFRHITGIEDKDACGKGFVYGPSAGGLIETIRFRMRTDGERIEDISPDFSYKSRHLSISGLEPEAALLRVERLNGFHSAAYSTLFCRTVEEIHSIDVSRETQFARIIMCELERIASHLYVVGRLCEAASQNVATSHVCVLREKVLRIISRRFGHRYFFGVNSIGGISRKLNLAGIEKEINAVADEFCDIWDHLQMSTIFIDRIQNTCTVNREWTVGPVARASGFPTDERWKGKLLPYNELSFKYILEYNGDSLSRALVRSQEISESAAIIDQACGEAEGVQPSVPHRSDAGMSTGEYLGRIESPGGEIVLWLSEELGRIKYGYIRGPSLANLPAFISGIRGSVFTDFSFGWESFGMWVAEMGGLQ
ncbi:MAG: formate hydrogenlyase [Thermoplasmata archaeon]|uniref:Formate hydrogenlyase n=1 Tax=Candidatus Sysuiplasma superficiale TaxID=2823368 RepID=A0A8J7YS89_9ARCH|nr:formate hydrogenlyase [Candidatus Sysuiplasma superficiale]MBX8643142.1 formate hydrogenlyase [Candidatus Sysuiplasma superficiale]MCL4346926.1 formate hydrogenlyase [Candidatus Thermoplasmatota archaeon]